MIEWNLEIWVPQSQSQISLNALKESFPYRPGDWFDQTVTSTKAPSGYHLAYIHLVGPLSDEQVTYLEHGKTSGLVAQYNVYDS